MFGEISEYINLLRNLRTDYNLIYIFIMSVVNIAFIKITVPFCIDFFNPYKDNKPNDLLKVIGLLVSLVLLSLEDLYIFILSSGITFLLYFKIIRDYINSSNPMALEKNKYLDKHHLINKNKHYDFIQILFLYNLISLEDYENLYEKHYDKSDSEKLNLLKKTYILNDEKELLGKYLYSKYKESGSLIELDEEVIIRIKSDIKKSNQGE